MIQIDLYRISITCPSCLYYTDATTIFVTFPINVVFIFSPEIVSPVFQKTLPFTIANKDAD